MPTCRNCHHEISKFDNDVCPFCGCPHPIADNYQTKDMTQFVNPVTGNYKLYRSKSRHLTAWLCFFFGSFGVHSFYLGFIRRGLIELLTSLLLIGGAGFALYFTLQNSLGVILPFVIPFGVLFISYALVSIHYFSKDSLKDSRGEFLH